MLGQLWMPRATFRCLKSCKSQSSKNQIPSKLIGDWRSSQRAVCPPVRAAHQQTTMLWPFSRAKSQSKLQRLLETASTFANGRWSDSNALQRIEEAIADVPLEELGLAEVAERVAGGEQAYPGHTWPMYQHIFEDRTLSMGIFVLPASTQLPLHDHPGMTVVSRVLFGSMHVKSFDWSDPEAPSTAQKRTAQPVADRILSSSDSPTTLRPRAGGNMHQLTALQDCAILDVLTPPYDIPGGRHCTYYQEVPPGGNGSATMLQVVDPGGFQVKGMRYNGIKVAPS